MKELDYDKIKEAAKAYNADMTAFLRAMISHPSESCEEGDVVACIKAEMEKLGFDEVKVDGLGNVMGFMGTGDKIIAIDGHIDTVGIGNRDNWDFDPYEGFEDDQLIGGRGGSDQEGGVASATYAAKMMKDMDLIPEGYKIMVVGSVQEEDCDGMCWQYIYNVDGIKPEFVISTEPTDGGIYRGHRGRMEIRVDVRASPATAPRPSAATTPSTRWRTSSLTCAPSTTTAAPSPPPSRAWPRCLSRSSTPTTTRTPASWAAAPAPSARSTSPAPAAAPWPTPAPSPSTAA